MAEERYTFAQARTRLEDIVVQVRKKDTSLEKSLDLLEEGVRLANACTELSDHTEWRTVAGEGESPAVDEPLSDAISAMGDNEAAPPCESDAAAVDEDPDGVGSADATDSPIDEARVEAPVDADEIETPT